MSWDRQAVVAGRVYARSHAHVAATEMDPAAPLALGSIIFFMLAAALGLFIFAGVL